MLVLSRLLPTDKANLFGVRSQD